MVRPVAALKLSCVDGSDGRTRTRKRSRQDQLHGEEGSYRRISALQRCVMQQRKLRSPSLDVRMIDSSMRVSVTRIASATQWRIEESSSRVRCTRQRQMTMRSALLVHRARIAFHQAFRRTHGCEDK